MTQIQHSTAIKGSIAQVAAANNTSIAETFISADTIILVDTSSSMCERDAGSTHEPLSRYDAACNELAKLQASLPGKIAVISFSSTPIFCADGVPTFLMGGTALAEALEFVRMADGLVNRFIVISDGEPQNAQGALIVAKKFTTKIDTVFVGDKQGGGQAFLVELAKASGGQNMQAYQVAGLAANVQQLLLTS